SVAQTANGLNDMAAQLAPQMVDMDIDGIAFQILVVPVDAVTQLFGTQNGMGFVEQGAQQGQFAPGQADWLAIQSDMAGRRTEAESSTFKAAGFVTGQASCQHMQTRQPLVQVKRLDDVVIASAQRTLDPVMQRIAGGQDQNG